MHRGQPTEPPQVRASALLLSAVLAILLAPLSSARAQQGALGPAQSAEIMGGQPARVPHGEPPPAVTRLRSTGEGVQEWTFPRAAGSPALTCIRLETAEQAGGILRLITSAPVDFGTFVLGDPSRIVIDVPGLRVDMPPGSAVMEWRPDGLSVVERVRVIAGSASQPTRVIADVPAVLPFRGFRAGAAPGGVDIEVLLMPPRYGPVVVDPGHGGTEPGAIGPSGTKEKDVNLAVGLRLQRILLERGIVALLTRADDIAVDLWERAYLANECGASLFVSIHSNASRGTAMGTEVYHTYPGSAPLASRALRELIATLGRPDRGVHTARFVVTRVAEMPAILCELAFIDHPEEERLLTSPRFQEAAAQGIARAIEDELRALQARPL